MTQQEFAQKIKQKYPVYKNIDDATLVQKVIAKYPVYKDQITDVQNEPGSRNVFQKVAGAVLDPIAKLGTEFGQEVGKLGIKGAEFFMSPEKKAETEANLQNALQQGSVVPGLGTEVKPLADVTAKDVAGQAIGAASLAVGSPALAGAGLGLGSSLENDDSLLQTAFNTALGSAGGKVLELVGKPIFNVAGKVIGEITPQFLKDLAGKGTEAIQNFAAHHDIVPNFVKTGVEAVGKKAGAIADTAKNAIKSEFQGSKAQSLLGKITPESATIMNRVARLDPTDARAFEKMTGMTHGEYLTKTGNFGTPDKIIENEAKKFAQSIQEVDDALAKLPGNYKSEPLTTASDELLAREERVSSPGAPSPDLVRAQALNAKLKSEGLTQSEINELKRLYERNVKLGYAKDNNSEAVARATNVDTALRNWQFAEAKKLGLKNLDQLNKQTQASRFIVDKLGKKLIGQIGNNGLSLTDAILIAGGDFQSIAGYLTKKFFSDKAVQSKIAKILADNPSIKQLTADLVPTTENAIRRGFPEGLPLQLPAGSSEFKRVIPSGERIYVAPKDRNIEMVSKNAITPAKTPPQLSKEKGKSPYKSTVPQKGKDVKVDLEALQQANPVLFKEAKKAKTAQLFIDKMSKGNPSSVDSDILIDFWKKVNGK